MTITPREVANPLPTRKLGFQESAIDTLVLGATLFFVAWATLGQSAQKLFWYDELITLRLADLPTLAQIFRFYESGRDTTSFLPTMLVHLAQKLPGREEVVTRLPFMLAYLIACACVWLVLRRRYSAGYASGTVFLLAQGGTFLFASEIRAYAFVIMGLAIALASWESANQTDSSDRLAAFGVFLGLGCAVLFHVFAIFLFVPFAFAEWFHRQRTRRTRWGMWFALLLFPAMVAVVLPTTVRARAIYGNTFWAKPTVGDLMGTYTLFLVPIGRDFAEIAVLGGITLWLLYGKRGSKFQRDTREDVGFTWPEWGLLLGIVLIPFIAFLGAKVLGVFRPQYVLYFEVGATVFLVGSFAEGMLRNVRAGWAFAGLMFMLFLVHSRDFLREAVHELNGRPVMYLPSDYDPLWGEFIRTTPLPVVADGPLVMLPLEQYAPADLKRRLVLLTSRAHSLQQPKSVTTELNMEVFGRELRLPLEDYDQFTTAHREFLLIVTPTREEYSWLFSNLLKQAESNPNVSLKLIWSNPLQPTSDIYEVHLGPLDPTAGAD